MPNQPLKQTISRSLLRAFFNIGIRALNKKQKRGEMNIREMRKEVNAPGIESPRKVFIEFRKPKFLKGYYVDDTQGVVELPTNDISLFNYKIIVYDGVVMFDFLRGWRWYWDYENKKWYKGSYKILDAWALKAVDVIAKSKCTCGFNTFENLAVCPDCGRILEFEVWVGDMGWLNKVWDVIMDEIRDKLKSNIVFRKMMKG